MWLQEDIGSPVRRPPVLRLKFNSRLSGLFLPSLSNIPGKYGFSSWSFTTTPVQILRSLRDSLLDATSRYTGDDVAPIEGFITNWLSFLNNNNTANMDYWAEIMLVLRHSVRVTSSLSDTLHGDAGDAALERIGRAIIRRIDGCKAQQCFTATLLERHQVPQQGIETVLPKWEALSLIYLDYFKDEIIPSMSSNQQYVSHSTGMNTLHLSIDASYYKVVDRMIQAIKEDQQYHGHEDSRKEVMTALDRHRRNYLCIAIEQLNFDIITCLLQADKDLLDQITQSETGPLHRICERIADLSFDIPSAGVCCDILQAIVSKNPDILKIKSKCYIRHKSYPATTPYKMLSILGDENIHWSGHGDERLQNRLATIKAMNRKLEALIWSHFEGSDLREAGLDQYKLTDLPLSDFDSLMGDLQTNDISVFVENFLPQQDGVLQLPPRLSRLVLPTLSSKASSTAIDSVKLLLKNLQEKFKIEQIVRLFGRDSTGNLFDDDMIAQWVQDFKVEYLDWHKRDFDITSLKERADNLSLRSISLYTTGHWGVIYHWLSQDGLLSIPRLKVAFIYIESRETTQKEMKRCKGVQRKARLLLEKTRNEMGSTPSTLAEIHIEQRNSHRLRKTINQSNRSLIDIFRSYIQNVQDSLSEIEGIESQQRAVVVALLDNGVSPYDIQHSSSVTAGYSVVHDAGHPTTLPWFTSRDNHGTHMADLITRVNPYCKLWACRIHTWQGDIKVEKALEGLSEVLKGPNKPDIINLSWSIPEHNDALQQALKTATDTIHRSLIFSSKSPHPFAANSYPADYEMTISVDYGSQYPRVYAVNKPPDIIVLGEDVPVESPSYAVQQETSVSGPSVATALASGIASLVLTLAKIWDEQRWELLKVRTNMLKLFDRLKVDSRSNVPYVDPRMLFSNLGHLKTEIVSILNQYERDWELNNL